MICPFCGSSDVQGPSRMTAAWQGPTGSPLQRQWFVPTGGGPFMACGNCHEEFDAMKWYGMRATVIVVHSAA